MTTTQALDEHKQRLSWRDLVMSLFFLGAGAMFWVYAVGVAQGAISGARFTVAAMFVLALMGAAVSGDAQQKWQTKVGYQRLLATAGSVTFALFLIILLTASDVLLVIFTALLGVVWIVTLVRHAMGLHVPPPTATESMRGV